jgi:acyl-CoA dehydrogenase
VLGGTAEEHVARYAATVLPSGRHQQSVILSREDEPNASGALALSASEATFREEVRRFLGDNLADEMRRGQLLTGGVYPEPEFSRPWQKALQAKGWAAPLWPVEHGGTGWTGFQRFIFETECALAGAPIVYPMGLRLLAPVLLAFGSDEQKRTYLPRILSAEDWWCQGFSEPGAGSDLASLATRAVLDGDDYVVNGSKLWTTHAHHANKMFALVRTDPDVPKQQGISFIIIDLDAPGVEVRPITSIGGDHDVNQVFFQDVRVPRHNLVGEPNKGWTYAKYLLQFERGAGLFAGRLRSGLKRVQLVMDEIASSGGDLADAQALASRIAEVAIDIDVFEMLELKTLGPLAPGENPGPLSSVLKLRASRLKQAVSELGIAVLRRDAARWPERIGEARDVLVSDYLNARSVTIFGGAKEVQLGIIAHSLAGL